MTRKEILDLLKAQFTAALLPAELRRDLTNRPLEAAELPRLVINDGQASLVEDISFQGGVGGFRRWRLELSVIAAGGGDGGDSTAMALIARAGAVLDEMELANYTPPLGAGRPAIGAEPEEPARVGEILRIEVTGHDAAVVQEEERVVFCELSLAVEYTSGRWEF